MSYSVYGHFYTDRLGEVADLMRAHQRSMILGVFQTHVSELYNYPAHVLPKQSAQLFCFLIGDSPKTRNATYLVDGYDYDSMAEIALPRMSKERLMILAELFQSFIELTRNGRIYVAITECDPIARTKNVHSQNILDELLNDIEREGGPPDTLYCIEGNPRTSG